MLALNAQQDTNCNAKLLPEWSREVPWQIWVVTAFLVIEGVNNLLTIPVFPAALWWVLAKCLFIVGLVKGWKWVFGLFLVITTVHVFFFLVPAPVAAVVNLTLIVLTFSAFHFYFPASVTSASLCLFL